jgi:deoxyribonuclease V
MGRLKCVSPSLYSKMQMPRFSHPWCLSVAEAEILQKELAGLVESADRLPETIGRVAGVDVAYDTNGDRFFAAVVVQDAESLSLVETATHQDQACFPYIPGLFSFREIPPIASALAKLAHAPDLLVCEGHGIAHPRRFGLACHVGVMFEIPTIGCAKSCLVGDYQQPGERRGDYSPLTDQGQTIGAVLRTQDGIKPLFVSIGHRVSLSTACAWILRLASCYRQPEPIRQANQMANQTRMDSK